jgi:hypothetical protein
MIDFEAKYGPILLACVSASDPTKVYHVRWKNGSYSCNCKGWVFSKNRKANGDKQCKHTIRAEQMLLIKSFAKDGYANAIDTVAERSTKKSKSEKTSPKYAQLDPLLACLGSLRFQVTDSMKSQMMTVIESFAPQPQPQPQPPTQLITMIGGVRSIVFDD